MARRTRKWPSVEASAQRAKLGNIYDFTDDPSLLDLSDEEWEAHMVEVRAELEKSPYRDQVLALFEKREQAASKESPSSGGDSGSGG